MTFIEPSGIISIDEEDADYWEWKRQKEAMMK